MSGAMATIIKIIESLPVELQEQVVEHLQEYIFDLQDEMKWDESFQKTQSQLVAAAKRAKQEITQGQATALDHAQL